MFTPKPQEYTDPLTGEMKKKQIKFFPDVYKDRIGKSYNDYIAGHQMNLFEDFIGYQGSAVLDEPEQKKDHQFKGRYEAEKNAVIISLEKDEREW